LKATIKHLMCLEYSTVAIQNKALADFLAGPEHIFSILESALPEAQDAQRVPRRRGAAGATRCPADRPHQGAQAAGLVARHRVPAGPRCAAPAASGGPAASRTPAAEHPHPGRALVPAVQRRRCHVTTADGRGVVYRQRDRAKMFALLRTSLRQHIRLARKYNRMRKVYRDALPALSSQQKWEAVLNSEVAARG
jgi:galactofuranosylgalactofuranosylrhamnosyl-N-acetylglucosaminyl-diphospho-decaprenol beta-1,5/1,6-galactofuranosyltransferase